MPNDDYFVSVGCQWTNIKIGKIVTIHQRELFKKIPRLGTFCTQSVNKGLSKDSEHIQWNDLTHNSHQFKRHTCLIFLPPTQKTLWISTTEYLKIIMSQLIYSSVNQNHLLFFSLQSNYLHFYLHKKWNTL